LAGVAATLPSGFVVYLLVELACHQPVSITLMRYFDSFRGSPFDSPSSRFASRRLAHGKPTSNVLSEELNGRRPGDFELKGQFFGIRFRIGSPERISSAPSRFALD
jgi:hypothetical protein